MHLVHATTEFKLFSYAKLIIHFMYLFVKVFKQNLLFVASLYETSYHSFLSIVSK